MRVRSMAMIALCLLMVAAAVPNGSAGNASSGGYAIRMMDLSGDTMEAYYVERGYDGLDQLDITLFRTYDERSTFFALLRVDDELSVSAGFLYSMSFWDLNIVVDSGSVQVWKGDGPGRAVAGVDVTWEGPELRASMPRSLLDLGAAAPSAAAQYYRLDALGERRMETVMDTVEWKGSLPLDPYEIYIPDPKDDVVISTIEMESTKDASLDMRDVRSTYEGGVLKATIALEGVPRTEPGVRYRVILDDLDLQFSGGKLSVQGSGAWNVRSSGAEISGSDLVLEAVLSEPMRSPFRLYAETLEWTEGGGWKGDSVPGPEGIFTALLPFDMGRDLAFAVRVGSDGEVMSRVRFSGFEAELASMVRERSDADGDGFVTPQEAEALFTDALDCIEGGVWMELPYVDGSEAAPQASVRTEGLIGPTSGSDDLLVEYTIQFGGPPLHDGWGIRFPRWQQKVPSDMPPLEDRFSSVEITVPEGYSIKPSSLEPALLGNHLTKDGGAVAVEGTGIEPLHLASGGFSLEVVSGMPGGDDGTGPDKDIGPWPLYLAGTVALVIFIAALIAWWRYDARKES